VTAHGSRKIDNDQRLIAQKGLSCPNPPQRGNGHATCIFGPRAPPTRRAGGTTGGARRNPLATSTPTDGACRHTMPEFHGWHDL